jgi:peptidoglycan/xylan/chitin deacetylase (PgdA/CDA1 family)
MDKKELWDIFTAKQEFDSAEQDQHGRFPFSACSFDPLVPHVSKWLYENGFKPEYPGGKKMAVCVSHDVDRLFELEWGFKTMLNQQVRTLLKLNFPLFIDNFKNKNRRIWPNHHLRNTLNIGNKYGVRSSFYFLSLKEGDKDFNYQPAEVKRLYRFVDESRGESGLHGGHECYQNHAQMVVEKRRLEKATGRQIKGYRGHYLKFDVKKTWEALIKAGFTYDTTYGFAETPGFRNGMCYPFNPYNTAEGKYYNIAEIPLVVMDESLFSYLKLDDEQAFEMCKKMIDTVGDYGGVFTFLWHNNYMTNNRGKVYERVIRYMTTKNVWFTTSEELVAYWKKKGYFEFLTSKLKNLDFHA